MSFTFNSQYVFYVDFTELGTTDGDTFSTVTKTFNYSELLDRADNYVIAIERFNVPTSTVSMQKAQPGFMTLRLNNDGGGDIVFDLNETYSLLEFLQQLNGFHAGLIFSLTSDLRMAVSYDWTTQELALSDNAACIFDMPPVIGTTVVGQATIRGASPIPDNFDRLQEIELLSGETLLQQQQEIQSSEVLRFLLTDFLIPNPYSTSFGFEEGVAPTGAYTISYPVRQDIQFFAGSGKRPIMMKGKSPVQNMKIEALAVVREPDGTRARESIRISPCGYFNVKLGFYLKNF